MTRSSLVRAADRYPMTDWKVSTILNAIRTTDICNVICIASWPRSSSHKKKDAVDFPSADEDDDFLRKLNDLIATRTEFPRLNELFSATGT